MKDAGELLTLVAREGDDGKLAGLAAREGRPGVKWDAGKPDYSLLPWAALDETVRALTYGASKYSRDNWCRVPDYPQRYLAAALRHITAHARGEERDPESGLHHLAHGVVSLMFILEGELKRRKGEDRSD